MLYLYDSEIDAHCTTGKGDALMHNIIIKIFDEEQQHFKFFFPRIHLLPILARLMVVLSLWGGGEVACSPFGFTEKKTVFGISRNDKTTENDGKTINNVQT